MARMYDYLLGGKDNFRADREAADKVIRQVPKTPVAARQNRDFLRRAVRFLAGEAGIGQFIDVGAGLPTAGNTHEIAQGIRPDARVAYVDYDPAVIVHGNALLADQKTVKVIRGDLTDPAGITGDAELQCLIRPDEPVAVLLLAILHFIPDSADPWTITARLMNSMPDGSYLALSHSTSANLSPADQEVIQAAYAKTQSGGVTPRSYDDIKWFFEGLSMAEPGLVDISEWRPGARKAEGQPGAGTLFYGGIGKKEDRGLR